MFLPDWGAKRMGGSLASVGRGRGGSSGVERGRAGVVTDVFWWSCGSIGEGGVGKRGGAMKREMTGMS
jgi:hypothetical protein